MAIRGVKAWSEKLGKCEMPVLGDVVSELSTLTGDDDTELNQLAEVILRDANLTSQVLRIANSVQYNPNNSSISTVSRAIVLLGFNGVKAICISVMVIDTLLAKNPKLKLLERMAMAFHAAVQARGLVSKSSEDEQEEVFIASLLLHLGEMAFWSMGGAAASELDNTLSDLGSNTKASDDAVKAALGCSFKAISKSLASDWHLGDTLQKALGNSSNVSDHVQAVLLGDEISRTALQGWDSPEMEETLYKVSRYSGLKLHEARALLEDGADKAAAVALNYGAAKVCPLIPSRSHSVIDVPKTDRKPKPMQANPALQLSVLRDLSDALLEKLDVNSIFQMVLEGLHRGVGLERVVLAFVQKQRVKGKFVLGEGTEKWREQFDFSAEPSVSNVFTKAITDKQPIWVARDSVTEDGAYYSPEVEKVLGQQGAFLSGIFLGSRCVALFYADRWDLGGSLNKEQFQNFRHFMLQTQLALQTLAQKP